MINARVKVPAPVNEPVLAYAPGSAEKEALKAQLERFTGAAIEIPAIVGGRDVTTGDLGSAFCRTTTARSSRATTRATPRP